MALPAMPALLLALLLQPGCSGHQPQPPSISTYQHHLLETVAAAAEPASIAAMSELVAALDAGSFRTALAECCPHIAQLTAPALFAELEAEFAVTEQVHNIRLPDGGGGPGGGDVTLALAKTLSWFPNLWELPFLSGHGGCDSMQDNAEVELFGFRPFAEGGNAARWDEVTQRPIYIAFNQMRLSLGNPIFGPISFVFSPAVVRNMTFVAPVDTGIWEMSCNHTGSGARSHHHGWPTNCSGWNGEVNASTAAFVHAPLGTMEHHTHVWLQNTRFWNLTDDEGLTLLFGRLFAPSKTNLTGMAQNYCECNARTPTLHSSVPSIPSSYYISWCQRMTESGCALCYRYGGEPRWVTTTTRRRARHHRKFRPAVWHSDRAGAAAVVRKLELGAAVGARSNRWRRPPRTWPQL